MKSQEADDYQTYTKYLYLQLRHLQENIHFFLWSCCKTKRTLEDFCPKTVFTSPRFLKRRMFITSHFIFKLLCLGN